ASFLREAIRHAHLAHARTIEARAESAAAHAELAGRARMGVGRAIRLDRFLALAAPFVGPHGIAVALQTPRSAGGGEVGTAALRPSGQREYRLPACGRRMLLFFAPPEAVS